MLSTTETVVRAEAALHHLSCCCCSAPYQPTEYAPPDSFTGKVINLLCCSAAAAEQVGHQLQVSILQYLTAEDMCNYNGGSK